MRIMDKISVVIATFNGEKFIEEQLESIRLQSLPVDEVLIFDDCSTDNTVKIIKQYIYRHHLDKWFLKVNTVNLGWRHNFINLLFQASGDIIFYCDQDDIWDLDKIKIMMSILKEKKEILCLATQFISIDSKGNVIGQDFIKENLAPNATDIFQISIDSRYFFYVPLGCTLAFRKKILKYIDPLFWNCGADQIIVRTAMFLNGMYILNLALIKHRFHDSNASNTARDLEQYYGSSNLEKRIKDVKDDCLFLIHFQDILKLNERQLPKDLIVMINLMQRRLKILKDKDVYQVLYLLMKFSSFSIKVIVIADFLYALKLNKIVGKICKKMHLNLK